MSDKERLQRALTAADAAGDTAAAQELARALRGMESPIDQAISQYEDSKTPVEVTGIRGAESPHQTTFGASTGGFAMRPTQEIQDAPGANFGAALKSNLVEDTDTKRRLIAESLFPNDPNGIQRVGFAEGKAVFVDDSGQLREVSSMLSRFGAGVAATAPEIVGGTIGSFATGNPVIGGAVGAAGGRAFKRGVSQLLFDEPATPSSVAREMATEGTLTLGAGLAGKGIARFADRTKTVDFTPRDLSAAEATRTRVKNETGIDIDLAQASGDRKLIGLRAYGARFPGDSADLVQASDDRAIEQFEAATSRVLDKIASAKPSDIAGSRGVNAAQQAIRTARKEVNDEVRPLYDAAYAAVPVVDRTTKQGERILDYLKLPYFREAFSAGQKLRALETGSAANARTRTVETLTKKTDEGVERASTAVDSTPTGARRVTSRLTTEDAPKQTPDGVLTRRSETTHVDITRPSLAELDYTKRALDERIESLMEAGQRQRARALKIKRDEFVQALDALPNQEWQRARQTYGLLAKAKIEPLENGVVGVLAKIKDPKVATAGAKIFNDPNVTPATILQARHAISKQGPEAWNDLVRQWMGQKFNRAMKETQTGDVINPAGKFRQALFGTPEDRKRTMAMLPQGAARDFQELMFAAEKLASTPITGSNTMRDTEIKEQLSGAAAVAFRWLTSPRQMIRDTAERNALEQGTVAITEAILDPAKRAQLRRVVRMAPSTRQAILISSIVGGQVTKAAASSPDDQAPPLSMRTTQR